MNGPELALATTAANEVEAEMITGLLLEAGIPAIARPGAAIQAYMQASGPRDILVPVARLEEARAVLPGATGE